MPLSFFSHTFILFLCFYTLFLFIHSYPFLCFFLRSFPLSLSFFSHTYILFAFSFYTLFSFLFTLSSPFSPFHTFCLITLSFSYQSLSHITLFLISLSFSYHSLSHITLFLICLLYTSDAADE